MLKTQTPTVRATKSGSAKAVSVNSSQQKTTMPAMTSSGPRKIMAVVSVR
jgi:hypothetical protein